MVAIVMVVAAVGGCIVIEPWKVSGGRAAANRLAADPILDIRPADTEVGEPIEIVSDRFAPRLFGEQGGPRPLATVQEDLTTSGPSGPVLAELDAAIAGLGGWTEEHRSCSRSAGRAEVTYWRPTPTAAADEPEPRPTANPIDRVTIAATNLPPVPPRILVSLSAWETSIPTESAEPVVVDLGCLDRGPLPGWTAWPPTTYPAPAWCVAGWSAPAPSVRADAVFRRSPGPGCVLEVVTPAPCATITYPPPPEPPTECVVRTVTVQEIDPSSAVTLGEVAEEHRSLGDAQVSLSSSVSTELWIGLGGPALVVTGDLVPSSQDLALGRDLRAAVA